MKDFLVGFLDGFVSVYLQPDGTERYFRARTVGRVIGSLSLRLVGGIGVGFISAWIIYISLEVLLGP